MDRIVGIDFGKKRIGLAISDPTGVFASPLETVPTAKIIDYLKTLAQKQTIVRFVVGMPVNMDGGPSQVVPEVRAFIASLASSFPGIPLETEDERFTSVLAHRAMIDGGMKKSRRMDKSEVDKISASIILQTYLDRHQNSHL